VIKSRDSKKYLTSNPLKKKMINKFLQDFYSLIGNLQVKTILDIGCGEGFVDKFLFQKNPQYQIRGIDISKEVIKEARKRVPELLVQEGDAYNLPFKRDTFDLTICTEVLEHLSRPQKAILEARRVSREYCLFSVPNEPVFSLLTFFSGGYLKRLGKHPDHVNFWTKRAFERLIRKYFTKPIKVRTSFAWTLVLGEK